MNLPNGTIPAGNFTGNFTGGVMAAMEANDFALDSADEDSKDSKMEDSKDSDE